MVDVQMARQWSKDTEMYAPEFAALMSRLTDIMIVVRGRSDELNELIHTYESEFAPLNAGMDDVWMWFSGRPAVRACWHWPP